VTGTARIIRGNALALPIADSTVDLIVTSPPYFGLRSYQDGGEHYAGQIGAEPTPAEFVQQLVSATREMARVLKPSGSIWVNLGDTYREKSLLGIPWRYALSCIGAAEFPLDLTREMMWDVFSGVLTAEEASEAIDSWETGLSLKLRSEVIWAKTDGLPEAAKDRPRRTHEHWFQFTLGDDYFCDIDAIRESYEGTPQRRFSPRIKDRTAEGRPMKEWNVHWDDKRAGDNPLGKTPGSVWRYATSKFQAPDHLGIGHFAAFPLDLPRRIVRGWSPEGGTVLDPFGGTGTTALMAKALGRVGISVDMSADYCRLAEWRTNDRGQLAAAMQVEKPEDVHPDQLDLFGDVA
jgi:DNA modification methylase